MLSRQQLEVINRRTLKYPLQTAEKDYLLALVMQIISCSVLKDTLIFKGGTAIHHCYLEQYRFSEDLDFSVNQKPLSLEEMRVIFTDADYLSIKKDYLSGATVKIEKLQYTGPLVQPNSLKVEADFLQNVLLPPRVMKYQNVWGLEFDVRVMDVKEICAEKIRASSDRARYRDFYDLFLILEKYNLDLGEIVGYIKQKEIRRPISKATIKENWTLIVSHIESEMNNIYYAKRVDPLAIVKMIASLPFDEIR